MAREAAESAASHSPKLRWHRQSNSKALPWTVSICTTGEAVLKAASRRCLAPRESNYARDVISRMAPRDAAEEMLVAQLLFAHARVLRLTEMTQHATTVEMIRVIHEYADRASNTYRRLMLALAEYRRPFRTGDTIAVVQQANITNQQVVHAHENRTNEQGFERRGDAGVAANDDAATPLPIESVGTDFLAGLSEALETMGIVHGSKDRGR